MPSLPISGLPAAGALAAADLAVIVQGGVTVQTTVGAFSTFTATTFAITENFAGAADPTVNDDTTAGYAAGSRWFNTDSGELFICRDASAGAAVWIRFRAADHPGYIAGRFYPTMRGVVTAAGATVNTGFARFHPFTVVERVTVSELGARVTTVSAGGNFQLAIFAMDPATVRPTGLPLAYTPATLSTAVAAGVTGALNVNLTLEPGQIYFFAIAVDNSVAIFQTWAGTSVETVWALGGDTIGDMVGSATVANAYLSIAHLFAADLSTLNVVPASVNYLGASVVRNAMGYFNAFSVP